MDKYKDIIQKSEALSWNMPEATEQERLDKSQRERARYYKMVKDLGLTTCIDTSNMEIWDVGTGAVGGLSSVLPYKKRVCIEPLTSEYAKFYDVTDYREVYAEDLKEEWNTPSLIIISNSLDHCRDPKLVLEDIVKYSKYSCYLAIYSAINNAITHKHEAHEHSINPNFVHNLIDSDFETVWELKYPELRYGWVKFQNKVGQPAFCGLYRRTTQPNF